MRGKCDGGYVMRGPRFTSTGPVQEPPPLTSFISLWAGHSVGDECRADVRWVRAELFNRRPHTGTDGQESGCEGNARVPGGGMCTRYNGRCGACLRPPPARNPRPSLHSFPCGPAAPTSRSDVQIAASSKQTQLITGPSLAVGTPCSSRTAVA
jgi:hypothetical protein